MSPSPSTPHLSQLAFQLSQDGRHEQAMDLLKRANQSEPTNPYLAVNLGFCAVAAGQLKEAFDALIRAEALFSPAQLRDVAVLERLCQGFILCGFPERAKKLLEDHLPLSSGSVDSVLGLHASVCIALGEAAQALSLFCRLKEPASRDLLSAPLSSLLISQGRLVDAEFVLIQSPGTSTRADLITNLAILASEHGRNAQARNLYCQALELEPDSFVPSFNLSRFYFLQGDLVKARQVITRALSLVPEAKEGYQLLEQIESGAGDFNSALSVIQRWKQVEPNGVLPQLAESRILFATSQHQQLTALLPPLLSRCPGHPDLLALVAALPRDLRSLQGLSEPQLACFEPERQVHLHQGAIPDLLSAQLKEVILGHPTLHADRPHKPSRQGSQTHELFAEPLDPVLVDLVDLIKPKLDILIQSYTSEQRQSLAYPSSVDSLRFSGWGVVLESGGYQAPHAHPESLFSGVVYLRVPSSGELNQGTGYSPGSIVFYGDGLQAGSGSETSPQAHQSATYAFMPSSGDLILFPSFLWHGTVPFIADDQRICLAFNVLPSVVDPLHG